MHLEEVGLMVGVGLMAQAPGQTTVDSHATPSLLRYARIAGNLTQATIIMCICSLACLI